ncbi:MAG: CDP-glycerol glycerophosphotransferase family protein [Candidatus Hydrothermae bacterium]|nr:CDP-glycerol glycerophosphotransferase family protein [Candidatus Hydrothermae bacterium]
MNLGIYLPHLYHWPAVRPLYREARRQGWTAVVVPGPSRVRRWGVIPVSRQHQLLQALRSEGVEAQAAFPEAVDVWVTTDFVKDPARFGGRPLVLVNHGTGFKSVMYRFLRRQRAVPYHLMVEGPFRAEKIQREVGEGAYRVHVVGYIKLDPYPTMQARRSTLLAQWGLDPERPTLLYAPTYKPTSIFQLGEGVLQATRAFNLLIKLHPYSWEGKYAPHRHHRFYEERMARYPHARLVPPEDRDILPFLVMADAVLTEASSVAFEFAAVGKGVIFVDLPGDLRHSDGEPLLTHSPRTLFAGAFPVIQEAAEIPGALETVLNPPEDMQAQQEAVRRRLFLPVDGQAARRALEVIRTWFARL